MKREELEKLPMVDFGEKIPDLDGLYVISSRKKHESGFKYISVYGYKYNDDDELVFAKKLTDTADVLHIGIGLKTFDLKTLELFCDYLYKIDYKETGVAHYFAGFSPVKFKVSGSGFSDFHIEIVYRKEK